MPNFLGFVLLTLGPVLALFYIAFTKWSAFGSPQFTGLENFERLIGDKIFWTSFGNTLYYSAIHIPVTFVVSLSLALLLNEKMRGRAFFRGQVPGSGVAVGSFRFVGSGGQGGGVRFGGGHLLADCRGGDDVEL